MADSSAFAVACKQAARDLRRIPAELRKQLGAEVRADVADPLAGEIRQAWHGPHAAVLSAATKTRVNVDPVIVVGGARRVLRGGGSARSVVYGDEFGGGKRVKAIPSRPGRRGHRRRTTRQFPAAGQHAVFGTVEARLDETFDRWVEVVDRLILKGFTSGS